MRFSSLITLLLAVAALVLSLLCLLAGSSQSFLQNAELLTLNVSQIGHTSGLNLASGNSELSSILNKLEGELSSVADNSDIDYARLLNLTDYYSVHVLNYCGGYYEPDATAANARENTTYCSGKSALLDFNPSTILQNSLPDGISLQDLNWPSAVNDASAAIRAASKAMFICYIIGVIFSGFAVIGAFFTICTNGRLSVCLCFVIDFIAFIALGGASGVATAVIVKGVDEINQYGNQIGISATRGVTFLGMTWGATAAILLAAIFSLGQCCAGHRERRSVKAKDQYQYEYRETAAYPKPEGRY